ncbi:MAG: hypothetical protein BGO55_08070 [Sphingobacteriales bacterium 50-39]|nr:TonB family protein [Sphingobacteriales bacterium]OJW53192.1 MAG: hypothetical protein BGO55_08070 [Sphingobacteriales bacterium 50-39]
MPLPKTLLLALSLLTAGQLTFCQRVFSQDSMYYHPDQRKYSPDPQGGWLYRTKKKTDSGMVATYFFQSGKPHYIYHFSDDPMLIKNGEYKLYDSNGIVLHTTFYLNNKADGPESYYYSSGKLQATGTNKEGEQEGEWMGYYPNGKLSGKASYANGKQTAAQFFLEDGTPNKSATVFMKKAEFPGGPYGFLNYLNTTLKYPRSAVKQEIQGTVIVQFKVTKEGKLDSISVMRSVEKSLDEEALRDIRRSPDWEPAILGGLPIESWCKQPIVFKLQ